MAVIESLSRKKYLKSDFVKNENRYLNPQNSVYILKEKPKDLNKFYFKSQVETTQVWMLATQGSNEKACGKEEESEIAGRQSKVKASFPDHPQCEGSTSRRMTMMKLKGKQSTKEDQDPATGIQGGAYLLR